MYTYMPCTCHTHERRVPACAHVFMGMGMGPSQVRAVVPSGAYTTSCEAGFISMQSGCNQSMKHAFDAGSVHDELRGGRGALEGVEGHAGLREGAAEDGRRAGACMALDDDAQAGVPSQHRRDVVERAEGDGLVVEIVRGKGKRQEPAAQRQAGEAAHNKQPLKGPCPGRRRSGRREQAALSDLRPLRVAAAAGSPR